MIFTLSWRTVAVLFPSECFTLRVFVPLNVAEGLSESLRQSLVSCSAFIRSSGMLKPGSVENEHFCINTVL